jgi:hypothetical protein
MSQYVIIGVMGAGEGASPSDVETAFAIGGLIAQEGWVLLGGGRNVGIMDGARAPSVQIESDLRSRLLIEHDLFRATGVHLRGSCSSRGAKAAGGLTIGVLPGDDKRALSAAVDIPILTGMGNARNTINILSSEVVIACGSGGPGTISEIALALKARRPVILLSPDEYALALFEKMGGGLVFVANDPAKAIEIAKALLARQAPT